MEEAYIDLKDLTQELEDKAEAVAFDPQRLEAINSRLDELYTLEKKHHTDSAEGLVRIKEQIRQQLDEMEYSEEDIAEMERQLAIVKKSLTEKAEELTKSRTKAANILQEKMQQMLAVLRKNRQKDTNNSARPPMNMLNWSKKGQKLKVVVLMWWLSTNQIRRQTAAVEL